MIGLRLHRRIHLSSSTDVCKRLVHVFMCKSYFKRKKNVKNVELLLVIEINLEINILKNICLHMF